MEEGKRLLTIFSADNPITSKLQAHHEHPAYSCLVVNDENSGFWLAQDVTRHQPGLTS